MQRTHNSTPSFNVGIHILLFGFQVMHVVQQGGHWGVLIALLSQEKKIRQILQFAKKFGKYLNFIERLHSWRNCQREGKKRGKNERWDHGNNDTTFNWLLKQSNCR